MINTIAIAVLAVFDIVLLTLFLCEKRRNYKRNEAMLYFIDNTVEAAIANHAEDVEQMLSERDEKAAVRQKINDERFYEIRNGIVREVQEAMAQQGREVEARLANMALDFEQAQMAASRINDFGASLANIFDYDPLKAIQKGRTKEAS